MAYPPTFEKRPGESFTREIDFTGRLPVGRSLASATISAVDASGSDATGTVLFSTTGDISGSKLLYRGKAGTDGQNYTLLFVVMLDNGETLEELVVMKVTNTPS